MPDANTGRFYYHNKRTGETTWEKPWEWNDALCPVVLPATPGGENSSSPDDDESDEEYEDFGDFVFRCGCIQIRGKKKKRDQTQFETCMLMGREVYLAVGACCYAMGNLLGACAYCLASCAKRSMVGR